MPKQIAATVHALMNDQDRWHQISKQMRDRARRHDRRAYVKTLVELVMRLGRV
ncbi:hypothetical protein GF380_04030 [Candidatus Uhrbacteria bacterium]|nr:hypothetical protein [Candidatus Uhrbacteria bacterium]